MNGVHDMGGAQGFGPVRPEPNEPLFHAHWEREAMALTVAMGASGQWNIDQMRSARESLPPAQYLGLSYYQIWLQALQDIAVGAGLDWAQLAASLKFCSSRECRRGPSKPYKSDGAHCLLEPSGSLDAVCYSLLQRSSV